jgi:hypothetical protein
MARSQEVAVSADLSLEHNQLLPDEKMYLKLTVANRSGQELKLGSVSNWLAFTVLGEKNAVVEQLLDDYDYCTNAPSVPTGSTASCVFNLTPYFNFRQPGNYTIKATIKIPEWQQEVGVAPVAFSIIKGVRLQNIPYTDQAVGVPLMRNGSNQPPEVRKFYLERSDVPGNMQLFVRLTDGTGNHTKRLVPIGPYFSFTPPDVKMDHYNNLHVLHQTSGQKFTYCVIDTLGLMLERQTYEDRGQRPVLRGDDKGEVSVADGVRVLASTDLPPPQINLPVPSPNTNSPVPSTITNSPAGRR